MTWAAYNRRKTALRDLLDLAGRSDLMLAELIDATPGGREAFPTEADLLFELQTTWFQRLSGHLERLLSEGREAPELVAVTAWVAAAADLPSIRTLLDAHREDPAMRRAFAKELAHLATSSGAPAFRADLVTEGRRIESAARASWAATATADPVAPARRGLIARLRSAIAA